MEKVSCLFAAVVLALALAACGSPPPTPEADKPPVKPADVVVEPGQSIQKAIDSVGEGAVIEVTPGEYHEAVTVDKHGITLRGVVEGDRRPVFEGKGKLADALIVSGNDFQISGFTLQHYQGNGLTAQGVEHLVIRDLIVDDTGLYGVYSVESKNVLIEKVKATRIKDAALYVGQSQGGVVRDNEVYGNVAGIEVENSSDVIVENNHAHDNTGGILVFVLPGKVVKEGKRNRVINNVVENNNLENFGDPEAVIGKLPKGAGITIMAADETEVSGNTIRNNQSYGIAIVELGVLADPKEDPKTDPRPDGNRILANRYENNGTDPAGMVKKLLPQSGDLVWTGEGKGNCADRVEGMTRAGGAPLLMSCPEKAQADETAPPAKSSAPQEQAAEAAGVQADAVVTIQAMTFKPMHVRIKKGQTVAWINKDNVTHDVVSGKGTKPDAEPLINSGYLSPGGTFVFRFDKPGTYEYMCVPHKDQAPMRGATVVVEG